MNYENFGDVNPIQHGGLWIAKDETRENAYYVLRNTPIEDRAEYGKQIFDDMYVELDDTWIDWEDVRSTYGTDMENEIEKIISVVGYYSSDNFGSRPETLTTIELVKMLRSDYGVEVDYDITKYEVLSLDVWGNVENGFEVNQSFHTGRYIEIGEDDRDEDIINKLQEMEVLSEKANIRTVEVDSNSEYNIYINDAETTEPLFELQKVLE